MTFSGARRFFQKDIWHLHLNELPSFRRMFYRAMRIVLITLRGFRNDKCPLIASSLTFYTLLSIVPVAAMAFGIAKGFGFEKVLERELLQYFGGYPELLNNINEFAHSLLKSTRGGVIAGVGAAILIWTVIKLLDQIETALDHTWGITRHRRAGRKFIDYLAVLLVCPLLMVIYSSTMVYITTRVAGQAAALGFFSSLIFGIIKIVPFAMMCAMLALIYLFMPNTRVRPLAAFAAGIAAGTLLHIVHWLLIAFQVDLSRYNAIYGGFAAIPVFLLWVQTGWLIVLLGSELSCAIQNGDHFDLHPDFQKISTALQRTLALSLVKKIIESFTSGHPPVSAGQLASELHTSRHLVDALLEELVDCGIIVRLQDEKSPSPSFLPARDPNGLHVADVLRRLDHQGADEVPSTLAEKFQSISEFMRMFENDIEKLPTNRLVKAL